MRKENDYRHLRNFIIFGYSSQRLGIVVSRNGASDSIHSNLYFTFQLRNETQFQQITLFNRTMASKDNVITSLKHLDQIEEELHVYELLDENWFLIYSFLRGQSRGESYIRTILLNDKGLNQELGELFRTISTLSKEDNLRLGRYKITLAELD